MNRFRLPGIALWSLSTGFIFLVLMTVMRLCLFLFFNRQSHSFGGLFPSFFLGFRFDLKIVCILMLCMLIIGSIPAFNPFRSAKAKIVWKVVFAILTYVMILFYVVDFAHYAYLSQRLNASVMNYLEDAGISMKMVWQSYPVIKLLILLIVVTFLILWIRSIFF